MTLFNDIAGDLANAATQAGSPAEAFDADYAKRALDDLVQATKQYATGHGLDSLFAFIRRFPSLSPFNGMLLHIQNPGTHYLDRLKRDFGLPLDYRVVSV